MKFRTDWNQIRYLYAENKDAMVVTTLLVVPSVVMSLALVWVGYTMALPKLGHITSFSLSLTMVLLSIYSISETAPVLPDQVTENRERYRRVVGWAYLALSVSLCVFLFNQLTERWMREPVAASVMYLPQALALVGVLGGVASLSLLISSHRMPNNSHRLMVEAAEMDNYVHRTEKVRERRGKIVTWLIKRAVKPVEFNDQEMVALKKVFSDIYKDVEHIENELLKSITSFKDRIS